MMPAVNLEQEVDALERNLETVREQRDELLDLIEEILSGGFLRLEAWVEEAKSTASIQYSQKGLVMRTAPTDALIERYGRWLQNIGYDGGPDSPPMRMLAAYKSLLARIEAAEKVIEPFAREGAGGAVAMTADFRAAAQWQAGQEGEG